MPDLKTKWRSFPPWARWALAYPGILGLCAAIGSLTIGIGESVFLAGAIALGWSLSYIRLGGRKARVGRDPKTGRPLYADDEDARRTEIRKGLAAFAFALALWAPLAILAFMR